MDDGWMGRWRIDELVMSEQTDRQMNEQMDGGSREIRDGRHMNG